MNTPDLGRGVDLKVVYIPLHFVKALKNVLHKLLRISGGTMTQKKCNT
jgi:hypothetical protein